MKINPTMSKTLLKPRLPSPYSNPYPLLHHVVPWSPTALHDHGVTTYPPSCMCFSPLLARKKSSSNSPDSNSPKPENPELSPPGTNSISFDHEERMQAVREMEEPTQESAPMDTTVPFGTSIHSVPEDAYPIAEAEEDILATTSHEVFDPHAVVPAPEIAEAEN